MSGVLLFILVSILLYAALGLKRACKSERLVIYQKGKPVKVCEGRTVFVCPFKQTVKKFDVGSQTVRTSVKLLDYPQHQLASCKFEYHVQNPMKAALHADHHKATEMAVQSSLMYILSSAPIAQCLNESHYLEKQTMEVVNRQAASWGVIISTLTLSDFALHRHILGAIADLTTSVKLATTSSIMTAIAKQLIYGKNKSPATNVQPLYERTAI